VSVAVIVNPRARSNRKNPRTTAILGNILGDAGPLIAPASLDDLDKHARRLAESPPRVIGIHGGDGTIHKTVAALLRAFGASALPPLALLRGGTMNVIGRSLGFRMAAFPFLAQIVEDTRADRPLPTRALRCLQVGDQNPNYGFIFGNGLPAHFLDKYYGPGDYGRGRAVWILARVLGSALVRGPYARSLCRRFEGTVSVDGQPVPGRSFTGVNAATVREVGLGFKMNHRADEDPDRFSVVAIHGGPLGLALDLIPVHRGRGISERRAWNAIASSIEIDPANGENFYTIDGDLYRTPGRLHITMGPRLDFVVPHGH
jgi:diacylglycerol kinase family enzyme